MVTSIYKPAYESESEKLLHNLYINDKSNTYSNK